MSSPERITKKEKKKKSKHRRRRSISSSSNSSSEVWVEKSVPSKNNEREDWMSMTGMLKTYTKDDIKPKHEDQKKHNIDSYNPSTSSRELNPYWKNGGSGIPQSPESFRKSNPCIKPSNHNDYYHSRNSNSRDSFFSKDKSHLDSKLSDYKTLCMKPIDNKNYYGRSSSSRDYSEKHYSNQDRQSDYLQSKSSNWRKRSGKDMNDKDAEMNKTENERTKKIESPASKLTTQKTVETKSNDNLFLSDEKMNKLAAKIVKAEIMGDTKLAEQLKAKLEASRQYRKENPEAGKDLEDDRVMLISTNAAGNSRPLEKQTGDPRSKGGKRKANTHDAGQRNKYFANDDKYDLKQMFQNEKYGHNYDEEAELAKIASKYKNPNDDLEDIFMDEIAKNKNAAKDGERDKQRAINQHVKMEKTLENCEYCLDSKSMLKHLIVSCGSKVYVALPSRKSIVPGQCIITTIHHSTCVTSLDEDVWEEILDYRIALTAFFNSKNQDVIFYETATRLYRYPHVVINCLPLPRDVGDALPIYFKKALLECEAEWSMNKKVVELKGKNIRKCVPKGLPYFWVDFGMEPGFAHVIEDQKLFPKNFAEEIMGGIMDLDHSLWMKPQKEYGDLQRKKVLDFVKDWKLFDPVVKK